MNEKSALPPEPLTDLSAQRVIDFLADHPEFFQEQAALFSQFKIPHALPEGTVSLIERQVEVLRRQNQRLERRLNDFLEAGRNNDQLFDRLHKVALHFLALKDTISDPALLGHLRELLAVDAVAGILWITPRRPLAGFRVLPEKPVQLLPGDWDEEHPYCGRLGETLGALLFGGNHSDLHSIALIALGPAGREMGLLALGLSDPDHFRPGLATTYLHRLGQLLSTALGLAPSP